MHIPVLQVPGTGQFQAVQIPSWFCSSNSFGSTFHCQQPTLARVQRPSRQPWSAGAGAGSAGAAVSWPVDRLALHQLPSKNLMLQDVNPPGQCRPGSVCSSSRCRHQLQFWHWAWDEYGQAQANYVAPHVVKAPTLDWLGFTDKVSAAIAVTSKSTNKSSTPPTKAPGWTVCVKQIKRFPSEVPLLCAGRAPSTQHRWQRPYGIVQTRAALHHQLVFFEPLSHLLDICIEPIDFILVEWFWGFQNVVCFKWFCSQIFKFWQLPWTWSIVLFFVSVHSRNLSCKSYC